MPDRTGAGSYNRRVEILKPTSVRDPRFNEEKIEFVSVYSKYPAKRIDRPSGEKDDLSGNLVKGVVQITWDLRYIPNLGIKTDWKIRDVYDDILYNVVAPPTEVGFRQGIRVVTEIVQ